MNKTIKVLLIIIGIIIGSAILESSIRLVVQKINSGAEEQQIKTQYNFANSSSKSQKENQIKEFLDDVFDALNDNDYNYIYDLLDEDYRQYMFNDEILKLKNYLNENIKIDKDYEYIRIEQMGGMYQVLVGVSENNNYSSYEFTVKVIDDNTYTLMIGNYVSFSKINQVSNYANTRYSLLYRFESVSTKCFALYLGNNTSNEIEIEFESPCKLYSSNGTVNVGNTPNKIVIKPDEIKNIELKFKRDSDDESFIRLSVKENGILQDVIISLERDIM